MTKDKIHTPLDLAPIKGRAEHTPLCHREDLEALIAEIEFLRANPMATRPRAKSPNQAVGTPWEFVQAVEARFGKLFCDLAALPENAKAEYHITPEMDSLTYPWPVPGKGQWNWLNPPFAKIEPWVKRCAEEKIPTLVLVPASVGSGWFDRWVQGQADVLFLNPRLTFVGSKDPYPKDLMLLAYHGGRIAPSGQWRWK